MKIKDLLSALINASEKSANIARTCRSNQHLFTLLIEEKTGQDKNERFFQDFKTLADVIIQETIRCDVGKLFPEIKESIKGEESNKFQNTLGEKIVVEITDFESTFKMLCKVLDENENAARDLASKIHENVITEDSNNLPYYDGEIDFDVGIWIDPIDATAEFINANDQSSNIQNVKKSGLKCATVLIGAYNKTTGEPFLGIINQPFASDENGKYASKIFYGISLNENKFSNIQRKHSEEKVAVISSSETCIQSSFKTVASAGAGYKSLKVIEGDVCIYFLSKGSTFKWDTCACQGILRSLNGDIVDLKSSLREKKPIPLRYGENDDNCNQNGIIAYENLDDLMILLSELEFP